MKKKNYNAKINWSSNNLETTFYPDIHHYLFTHSVNDSIEKNKKQTLIFFLYIYDLSRALKDGYETECGERGVQLSGGQKQRIAIARAIIRNPTILLLDEATSALDVQSEQVVQEALDRIMVGRTTVVVAHRLNTIRHLDSIAFVSEGKVLEQGTYNQLKNKKGAFFELANLQKT